MIPTLHFALVAALQSPVASDVAALRWEVPASCPPAGALVERFEALVAGDARQLPRAVHARIERDAFGYRLALSWQGGAKREDREFEAETCELLVRVAAATLAVAAGTSDGAAPPLSEAWDATEASARVDPRMAAASGPGPRTRAQEVDREDHQSPDHLASRAAAKAPPAPAIVRETSSRNARRTYAIGLAPLAGGFVLPDVHLGAQFDFGLRRRLAEFRVGVRVWPPRERGVRGSDARVRLGLVSVPMHACVRPRVRDLEFPLCLGAVTGIMFGRARDLAGAYPSPVPDVWLAGSAEASIRWLLGSRVAVFVLGGGVVSIRDPAFEVLGEFAQPVHRAGRFGFRAGLGLEWRWSRRAR